MIAEINGLPKNKVQVSIELDGISFSPEIIKEQENINKNTGIISLKKQTETGEVLQDLNASGIDYGKMHKEDKRTKISDRQASWLTRMDVITEFDILPPECQILSVQHKRNLMSVGGWRAEQMKDSAIGISEKQSGRNFMSKLNIFSKSDEQVKS